jgi:uracil-DNA glycosylase
MTVDRQLLAQYLRQLAELGVDELVLDRLSPQEAVALLSGSARSDSVPLPPPGNVPLHLHVPPPATGPAAPADPVGRQAGHAAVAPAGDIPSTQPRRLAPLAALAAACTLCRLHETRSTVVFGEGSETADVVVVGEAPGQEEDRTGRPFVGRAGRLLDLLLMSAGFPRQAVYICNVLKCRPPGNRNPLPDEVVACTTSYLQAQVEAIAPRAVLAVGKFAAQALLGSEESIGRLRGVVHAWRGTPLIVTYHPAYLLRSPQRTRVAWQDFQLLRKVLDEQT